MKTLELDLQEAYIVTDALFCYKIELMKIIEKHTNISTIEYCNKQIELISQVTNKIKELEL